MTRQFNPEMLTLARESRGMTQSELASIVGVTQGKISKYELGFLNISAEDLVKIARVLDYPQEFFSQADKVYGLGSSAIFNRQRQGVPVAQQKQIQAQVNILRMRIDRLLRGAEIVCENSFQPLDIDEYDGNVEKIARVTRAAWRLPAGPIANLTHEIERAGGVVVRCTFGTRRIDAAHLWLPGMPPLFFMNSDVSADRYRFTLAHELGHAIMHRYPTGDIEAEADRFASEFLMPEKDIEHQLAGMTIQRAAILKPAWKVSMAAIIKRACDLSAISERQYRSLFARLSSLGYRMNEPIPIAFEQPAAISQLVEVYRREHGFGESDLRRLLLTNDNRFFTFQKIEAPKPIRLSEPLLPFFMPEPRLE
jgi:Zn-dependent peptidase ImmA (M78 family)/transcriptional regulator with XRE-family HTH domain